MTFYLVYDWLMSDDLLFFVFFYAWIQRVEFIGQPGQVNRPGGWCSLSLPDTGCNILDF